MKETEETISEMKNGFKELGYTITDSETQSKDPNIFSYKLYLPNICYL